MTTPREEECPVCGDKNHIACNKGYENIREWNEEIAVQLREAINKNLGFNCLKAAETALIKEALDTKDRLHQEELERVKKVEAGLIADFIEEALESKKEELAKLRGCDHLDAPYRKLVEENKDLRTKLDASDKVIQAAREALEFYANEKHYSDEGHCFQLKRTSSTPDSPPEGYEDLDYGEIARKAMDHLTKQNEKGGENV